MNLASIPAHLPFLDSLAQRWLGSLDPRSPDADTRGAGTILLPTRRAARALAEAFLRATGGRVLLLPRIMAIGALDEAPLALAGSLDLPPAVEPMRRLAELSRLVLAASGGLGIAPVADQAWLLSRSLAELMDEAERAETDLAERLPRLAETHAEHWQITLRFLQIVTHAWPAWLGENGLMNPVAREAALLRAQAQAWSEQAPADPVWAAGFSVASPALRALLAVVAQLPLGALVFQGLDRALDPACFETLPESHAQSGLSRLLGALGARREDVVDWHGHLATVQVPAARVPEGRVRALQSVLLPEQALGSWIDDVQAAEISGLSRLCSADQQEEAVAIALLLRDAIETPGRRAALITPDRGLAARVVVELTRFGVVVDDSAGEPLAASPPAVLLRLLARACADGLSPVSLLALLKHPFAGAGRSEAACRRLARMLELACLRGPAPGPGIEGVRQALARASNDPRRPLPADEALVLGGFLNDLERIMAPLASLCAANAVVAVESLLEALVRSAEALASTGPDPGTGQGAVQGSERLWAQEDGNALAEHLVALSSVAVILPPQPPAMLAALLEASLAGIAVRSRRALRGRSQVEEHPRLFIWGLLEARLQSVDVAVLGGLVEGVWPVATDPGPWMSRPMRSAAGLPSPEAAIGESARDFCSSACAAPELVLSWPARREGAPAVPARWLVRLDAWLRGRGQQLPEHAALFWLRQLDQPPGAPRPVPPPAPTPPLAMRPRRLSITEIETWMRDPYALHARHVLRLRKLPALEEAADAADYGTIVHDALQDFLRQHGAGWPADAAARLRRAFAGALAGAELRPALAAWWGPRLLRIADWVAETEKARRVVQTPVEIATEIDGRVVMSGLPGGEFSLRGRADRIERYPDASLALIDYKTGVLPTAADVRQGWASQLVLEAAMARLGGFGEALKGETASLVYWRLSGGHQPGQVLTPVGPGELEGLVEQCWEALGDLVRAYDDPAQPYLSQPRPGAAPRFSDYAELARVAEWSAAREEAG